MALAAGERDRAGLVLAGDGTPDGPPGAPAGPADPAPGLAAAAARLGRARLLLATGDDKGALETVEHWLDGTDPSVTLRDQVGALLVAAVAQRRSARSPRRPSTSSRRCCWPSRRAPTASSSTAGRRSGRR